MIPNQLIGRMVPIEKKTYFSKTEPRGCFLERKFGDSMQHFLALATIKEENSRPLWMRKCCSLDVSRFKLPFYFRSRSVDGRKFRPAYVDQEVYFNFIATTKQICSSTVTYGLEASYGNAKVYLL